MANQVVRMTMANTHEQNVIRAIHSLRHRFAKAIRIKELAAIAKMSETAFHRYFKTMTSMTPLQYQKQLRLMEARRLMLAESMNVETAAFQVGYESPSQFSGNTPACSAPPRGATSLRGNSLQPDDGSLCLYRNTVCCCSVGRMDFVRSCEDSRYDNEGSDTHADLEFVSLPIPIGIVVPDHLGGSFLNRPVALVN